MFPLSITDLITPFISQLLHVCEHKTLLVECMTINLRNLIVCTSALVIKNLKAIITKICSRASLCYRRMLWSTGNGKIRPPKSKCFNRLLNIVAVDYVRETNHCAKWLLVKVKYVNNFIFSQVRPHWFWRVMAPNDTELGKDMTCAVFFGLKFSFILQKSIFT